MYLFLVAQNTSAYYHWRMDTLNAKDKIKLLIENGMTEYSISEKTGIPQPTINRIKNGQDPRESYVRLIDSFFKRAFKRLVSANANKPTPKRVKTHAK